MLFYSLVSILILCLRSQAKKSSESNKQGDFALLPKIINGGLAGMISVLVVFPLDLVKTRLQNQPIGPHGERMYTSMFDCFKKTYKAEGYFGMYRGSAVNIFLVTPEKAVKLASNDLFRHYLATGPGQLPLEREMLAGGLAGLCQVVINSPMELLKIQLQDAGRVAAMSGEKNPKKIKAMDIARDIMRTKGFLGFYKGGVPCAFRDVWFSLLYFPLFQRVRSVGPKYPNSDDVTFYWTFLSGIIAGSFGALSATPFDVIKTRFQAGLKETTPRYTSMMDAVTKTFKNEGILAFFKGGACRMMIIAPIYGIAQTVYFLGIGEKLLSFF